ncbi:PepSY-associated TM helix domain-containing protein [Pseudoduganella violacea]|uniref:Putative iron-regulated membrane protein n=1 Tax=Pseudoduganella violacea TaxID=1715466 RepID=A0A7W5BCR1_9BURK|nr:PepSY-associated TM helix domain-containing protein [Pseudoduganella violacea]MBB3120714.1 putative iron-regulated membrane protein [Pseudoduganella violacea]
MSAAKDAAEVARGGPQAAVAPAPRRAAHPARKPGRLARAKDLLRTVHLWLGLVFGSVFVVLGLTGAAIAWLHEIDHTLNADLMRVAPPPGMQAGAPLPVTPAMVQAVHERLLNDPAYGKATQIIFPGEAGEVAVAWYKLRPEGTYCLQQFRQVMVDPFTLRVTGERVWGELGFSRQLLMPTLFHLHRYLVAGETGKMLIATSGVAMLGVALSGLFVWWPKATRSAWRMALTVRHGGSWPRFNFSLHRAAGFFAVPVLLVLGFSGAHFNQPAWIAPVINAVAPLPPAGKAVNRSDKSLPLIAPADAVRAAQAAIPQGRVSRLSLPAKADAPYEVRLRQPGELREGDGATRVSIDSRSGDVLKMADPLRPQGGEAVVNWLFPLHSGEAFGTAGRAFISVFGLMPLVFFATGLVIWSKRRRAKHKGRH